MLLYVAYFIPFKFYLVIRGGIFLTINVLVLIDDNDSKKMPKYELQEKLTTIIEKIAKEIDKDLKTKIKLLTELKEDCFDGKNEILETIALSAIIHDPQDVLGALKISPLKPNKVAQGFSFLGNSPFRRGRPPPIIILPSQESIFP